MSGQAVAYYLTGTAMTVRPLTGNYEISTRLLERNASLKGLVLYGDVGQSVGIGVKDNKIQVWEVKNQKRTILKEEEIRAKKVWLKMKAEKGYQCRFYWSKNGKEWTELTTGTEFYNGNFLPPWDRSPRPGLLHQGAATEPAVFSSFKINYY